MSPEDRQARKVAGLCIGSKSCRAKAIDTLCRRHRKLARKHGREQARAIYLAKKVAGLCVITGCRAAATETTVTCPKHQREQHDRDSTPKGKTDALKRSRASRRRRILRGLCAHCGSERLSTKTLGERCAKRLRDAKNARDAARRLAERRIITCRNCGEQGHGRCEWREPMPPLRIEDFMGAPSALAQEMAEGGGTGGHQGRRRAGA